MLSWLLMIWRVTLRPSSKRYYGWQQRLYTASLDDERLLPNMCRSGHNCLVIFSPSRDDAEHYAEIQSFSLLVLHE